MENETQTVGDWFAQVPSWFGDFFAALPDALTALYEFGDPSNLGQGWWGLLILLIWGVGLIGAPLLIAKQTYGTHEWVSASMATVAVISAGWWMFGILPSAWIYYVDSSREILEGTIIPASVGYTFPSGYRLDIASNFYILVRDLVVVIQTGVGVSLTIWGALRVQERFPRGLVEGEVKPDAGGYR